MELKSVLGEFQSMFDSFDKDHPNLFTDLLMLPVDFLNSLPDESLGARLRDEDRFERRQLMLDASLILSSSSDSTIFLAKVWNLLSESMLTNIKLNSFQLKLMQCKNFEISNPILSHVSKPLRNFRLSFLKTIIKSILTFDFNYLHQFDQYASLFGVIVLSVLLDKSNRPSRSANAASTPDAMDVVIVEVLLIGAVEIDD